MGQDKEKVIEEIKELLYSNGITVENEKETFQELKDKGLLLTRRVAVPKDKKDPDHGKVFIIFTLKTEEGKVIDDRQVIIEQEE